jgi:dephospho-CoA kinase
MILGIVGGIASGKSAVAEMCRQLGAEVIAADQIGHEVLTRPDTIARLRERWGERTCGPDGQLSRAAIASIVFAGPPRGPEELRFLESVTHPQITRRIDERIEELKRKGASIIVLDAPILIEAGWDRFCDRIVFVEVPREERLRRARQRGWTDTQFAGREASQRPVEEKRKLADVVIDNSGSFDHTLAQLHQFWHSLNSHPS